ncbi:hypothetical protein Taro_001531 [Colocasia esculenta]|uniref:Guanylate-binding protein/Atlastin C-terminal domain-containing protein n=1 Tax=Colocasia esculenta TaxID=4460 RepID=A0A843TBB6_COLES|nr:hypothetical protein [Colocasia esculenta]
MPRYCFGSITQDYKRSSFLEADLRCAHTIQNMEKKIRAACHVPDAKIDEVVQLLDGLCTEYETASHGPGKWQKLATFLQQCLSGPVLDLLRKQIAQLESENSGLMLRFRSTEDKLALLKKQLEVNERHRTEYMKRYEEAINDKRKVTENYTQHIANLQNKCSLMEERCLGLTKSLDSLKNESSDWKLKNDRILSEQKEEEDKYKAEVALLKSRVSASEGRLAAAREQAQSAHEEALEWKRKYDTAVGESKTALERAAMAQERTNKKAQEREDALRAECSALLAEKDEEMKHMKSKVDRAENHSSSLISQLRVAESMLKNHETKTLKLKDEIKALGEKLDSVNATALSYEREARILEQEKNHLEEKYLSEFKKFEEADIRCKAAEREAKRATELADNARADAVAAQKEKSDFQRLAMERLALIERAERQIEGLERDRGKLLGEVERLRASEMDAVSKVALLEERVEEREREIEQMLSQNNEQRSNTVQVLESLLTTERAARAEANSRAEALSLQLQSTQGRLDILQQELTSVRLNESALDSKLRTASHGKRSRIDECMGMESVQDMEVDEEIVKGRKRSKGTSSPIKHVQSEDGGSSFRGNHGNREGDQLQESEDYGKFTVLKLKQELTKHGFGAELLQLKNPNKKDILALYEKHVLKR